MVMNTMVWHFFMTSATPTHFFDSEIPIVKQQPRQIPIIPGNLTVRQDFKKLHTVASPYSRPHCITICVAHRSHKL